MTRLRMRLLRIDDVAPGFPWKRFRPYAERLFDAGIRPLVGVVPANQDPGINYESETDRFWTNVRELQSMGWNVAQHGYRHVYDSSARTHLGAFGRSEFAGHSKLVQVDRIYAGKRILQQEGLWEPIFMAPNHAFDALTIDALHTAGFKYITDGWGVYPYQVGQLTLLPQLFASHATLGIGVYSQCLHIGPMSQHKLEALMTNVLARRSEYVTFAEAVSVVEPISGMGQLSRVATRVTIPTLRRFRSWRSNSQ